MRMTLRTDHVAGVFFVGAGLLIIALSGDLPFGTLSFPGSGFLPRILAVLAVFFGLVLALRASESKPLAELGWGDARHAAMVVAITAAATAVFDWLGFVTTDILLIFALIVIIERRRVLPAALFSICVVVGTYVLFVYVLKTPLNTGPLGF
jgi:putative tricarboxylic transport membrane protein